MTNTPSIPEDIQNALDTANWDRVEALWLEAIDQAPIPWPALLEVRRLLWQEGKKVLATTLLELLCEALETAEDFRGALAALKELIRLDKKSGAAQVDRLEKALVGARADAPSLQRVLAAYDVRNARRPLEAVEAVELWLDHDVGTIVEVIGQGVGSVSDINLELANVKVDLGARRPVSVPVGAVNRYIRCLPPGDFLRRKVEDPEALTTFVNDAPGDALVEILESLGNEADVAAIKAALEDLQPPARWNTWWTKARKHPRIVSSGSGSRLRYSVSHSAESATEILLSELDAAKASDRPALARRIAARGEEAANAVMGFLLNTIPELEKAHPGLAWETAGVLLNLPGAAAEAEEIRRRLVASASPLRLLGEISDRSSRIEALHAVRAAHAESFAEIWSDWMLHEQSPSILHLIASALHDEGHDAALDAALEAIFRNHTNHPAQFVWAAERITDEDCPAVLRQRLTASLLEKIPDTLSRKEFAPVRSRAKSLLDGGRAAIRLLLDVATPQQAKRFSQRIERIENLEPQRRRLIEQAAAQAQSAAPSHEPEVPVLVATAQAIDRKHKELKQLLEVEIPKTLKGINAAAAEGDLRENFEYHMLRDRQELQSAQAAKLQQELNMVRTLTPGSADTARVNIGTVIHLEDMQGSPLEPVTILGVWDADVERRIFANGTELAQGLLGREVGAEVTLEGKAARIKAIAAWKG